MLFNVALSVVLVRMGGWTWIWAQIVTPKMGNNDSLVGVV